jgi:4,5-dihydroxyphthalate decarboxylase
MSAKLELSFACVSYFDRTRALQLGEISPKGIDLDIRVFHPNELFRRVAQGAEFDVAEMSTSTYMMMLADGDDRLIGIPVFLSRAFRHNMVFVNTDAGIGRPEDLRGKKVGLEEYQQTASVWVRAILEHEYGVAPSEIEWIQGAFEAPGYEERRPHDAPRGVSLEQVPEGMAIASMFEAGEIDAVLTFNPHPFKAAGPRIRRLFPDYQEVERDYYERTGFFPIMHTLVMRRDVYEANPWTSTALLEALIESKRLGMARIGYIGALAVSLPWIEKHLEEVATVFGGDPFPYGFAQNRAILEAMTRYSYEQGLTSRKLSPEELFAAEAVVHPGDAMS